MKTMAAQECNGASPLHRSGRAPTRAAPETSAYHRVAFEWSPDAIVISDAGGRVVDANPAALAMLGYERDELLQLTRDDLVPPVPDWSAQRYEQFLRDGLWEGDVEVRTKHGPLKFGVRAVVLPPESGGFHLSFLRDLTERKQSEATRARLAALVNSSGDAIIGETLEGLITDWNPAAERLYGYAAHEALGQPFLSLVPADRVHEVDAILERVLAGECIEGFGTVRQTKDGRRIDVSLTISPVWNDARQMIATSAIVRDISTQKAAERALEASEHLFRVVFADAPIGMVLTDAKGETFRVNRAICNLLGYTEAELLATTLRERTYSEDAAATLALIQRALAGEIDTFQQEKRYLRKDGQVMWASLHSTLIRDEAGRPSYFIAQIQDISARKNAEADLAATHQHTREVLERIGDGFYAVDRDWHFTYVNEAAERIMGRSREELLGSNAWEAYEPAVATSVYGDLHEALAQGIPASFDYYYPPYERWFEVRAYPSANGLSIFFRDITERKQADEELRAALELAQSAHRTKSLFLAMMSHELRTPLQAVLGYADFLIAGRGGRLTSAQNADIAAIHQGAQRMAALIERMLDLSRVEAGAIEFSAEPLDLADILEQVRADVTPLAQAKGLALQIELPPDLPGFLGDPVRVQQILLNLADNAVKFTEHGSVQFSARPADDGVDVAISDTGIGIAPDALPHIFEEFRQAESNPARRSAGAGLGLAIAQRLAEQMSGNISVTSQLHHGSTFVLHLPDGRLPPLVEGGTGGRLP